MPQARLRSERLDLVPLAEEHLPFLVELNSDPVALRYLYTRRLTAAETEARMRRWIAGAVDGLGLWVAYGSGDPIGLFMLATPDGPSRPGVAELGYRLPQRSWRQGFAKEGSRELVRHGFEDLGLDRIIAQTMAVNEASRATMASAGLTYARSFHEDVEEPLAGHEDGEVEYEITRGMWRSPV
ncbi:GNAT family N-acetyltransferase [Antribacter gilvus]|uniref:GNAT family N-acetyltransferase n=1 Tax=Antribacter gilvus TaxID=2304675 RepID=UPI000F78F11F|nr:GNAT family N-acetyltransferase [Antribacter gilvus]